MFGRRRFATNGSELRRNFYGLQTGYRPPATGKKIEKSLAVAGSR